MYSLTLHVRVRVMLP